MSRLTSTTIGSTLTATWTDEHGSFDVTVDLDAMSANTQISAMAQGVLLALRNVSATPPVDKNGNSLPQSAEMRAERAQDKADSIIKDGWASARVARASKPGSWLTCHADIGLVILSGLDLEASDAKDRLEIFQGRALEIGQAQIAKDIKAKRNVTRNQKYLDDLATALETNDEKMEEKIDNQIIKFYVNRQFEEKGRSMSAEAKQFMIDYDLAPAPKEDKAAEVIEMDFS